MRRLDGERRVDGEDLPAHGLTERFGEHAVDVQDGLRGEPTASVEASVLKQAGLEGLNLQRLEPAESDLAERASNQRLPCLIANG